MSWEVLGEKLEPSGEGGSEATWQLRRLPRGFSESSGPNYLFVAVGGKWRGYFTLADELLWNPEDSRVPYSLIFDTRTWTEIEPIPAPRFRGFTYRTPDPTDVEVRD